ncbi:MAG: tyrosine-type recombinase/integrase [Rhodospirillales bacterium]|nr:tyrosine-type recombinase/integrase [Rhodospirillales bacterium]
MKRPKTLNARFVETVNRPGRYGDGRGGHGLSLLVKPMSNGRLSKSWAQRLRVGGKPIDMGLGAFPVVTLKAAREAALANRRAVAEGRDPRRAIAAVPTFAEAAETVIELHAQTWRDKGKSAGQWRASLRDYAMPRLGDKSVADITSADVLAVLVPIWSAKRVTARRVRQRIGAILKWAVAEGYRDDNPAGDAITAALPKGGVARQHQRALPYAEVGAAIEAVRASTAYRASALAFEFLVLTAARSGEVRGARWEEIDADAATWTVPAERMKGGLEHRVPLSERALAVLKMARTLRDDSGLVFPSVSGRRLGESNLSDLCRRLGIEAVPHGFRSSFRQWAAERTNIPREVAELALAHVNSDRVEAAYQRSDLFERRRDLMESWARYLDSADAKKIVALRPAKR